MRYQDITITIDIDALNQKEHDKLIATLKRFTVAGEVNTMTYDDELMESLGYSSPNDFTPWEECWEGRVYLPMKENGRKK